MANHGQFPPVHGGGSSSAAYPPPPPAGVSYPHPDEVYPPYVWAPAFPGGFALPPGPNYDDNPAWVRFRQAMSHPMATPVVPEAARKRTNEVLARLSEERKQLMSRFPPLTPSSVGGQQYQGGFTTPLPRGIEGLVSPRGHGHQGPGPTMNVIHEESPHQEQAPPRSAPTFGEGPRFGAAEARSPEERAVAARRRNNMLRTSLPNRRSTIDNFLNRDFRRSLSADTRIENEPPGDAYEDKENYHRSSNMTEGRLRNHHLDQTAAFGSFEPAQVSPRLKRRSTTGGVPNRPARAVLFSRGTGNADIRDVHAMCCDACPCKNGGKAVCCEHCSLKDENRHKKRADRGEVKDTACNTDWEGEGVTKGGLSNAVKMRRKRPRNSSPSDENGQEGRRRSSEDVCHHIGPWRGEVPPRPTPPEDAAVPERIARPEVRKAGSRVRGEVAARAQEHHHDDDDYQQQLHHSSQTSYEGTFQSLLDEAEAAVTEVVNQHERRHHQQQSHRAHRRAHHRGGHREERRKKETGVPRQGGSLSSADDLQPDQPQDIGGREIRRTERRKHLEDRRQAELLRTGPVGGHSNPVEESYEDPDETARHLSFDEDLTFDVAVEAEPDFIVPVMDEEDTISDIPLPHDQPQRGGQHPFEEISFTNQHRRGGRGNKMVDTSLQVGPELYPPVPAPTRKKTTQRRRNRDPESSDGTLEEEFEQHRYGRGAPRSTRRAPLDILKGERIIYKRTDSGDDLMIGVLTRHKHDRKRNDHSLEGGRSRRSSAVERVSFHKNRASQESYDPNQSAAMRAPVSEGSSRAQQKRKGQVVEKRGKKKGASRTRQPQPKAKSRAARKKTGVINAKKGAQKVAAANASKGQQDTIRANKKNRDSRKEVTGTDGVVAHAHRGGGPTCAQYCPEDKCWKSDGMDREIPAGHKLVSYAKDRTMKIFTNVRCVVPLDSQHFMPVLFQLGPLQQKLPETVSEGSSAIITILECGEGGDKAVDEFPVSVKYEDKERSLGAGDFFIVRAGITYSILNEHRTKDAKILMVLRQDTVEDSGLNSDVEA